MKNAITLALCAILTACGGGGSESTADPTSVEVYGDSIAVTESQALASTAGVTVTSHARGGMTLREFFVEGMIESAVNSPADVVVIAYGTNDGLGAPRGYRTAQEFGLAVQVAATRVRTAGKRVVVETPPRVHRSDTGQIDAYAQAIRDAAQKAGAIVCDRAIATAGTSPAEYEEGVHPKPALNRANAARLAACIAAS